MIFVLFGSSIDRLRDERSVEPCRGGLRFCFCLAHETHGTRGGTVVCRHHISCRVIVRQTAVSLRVKENHNIRSMLLYIFHHCTTVGTYRPFARDQSKGASLLAVVRASLLVEQQLDVVHTHAYIRTRTHSTNGSRYNAGDEERERERGQHNIYWYKYGQVAEKNMRKPYDG